MGDKAGPPPPVMLVVGVAALLTVCFIVLRAVGAVTLRGIVLRIEVGLGGARVVGVAKGRTLVVCVLGGKEAPGEEMMPSKAM